jgi:calcineurin-like phosphoesterase family protein
MTPLEAVARALYAHEMMQTGNFDEQDADTKKYWFYSARAAIIALAEKLDTDAMRGFEEDTSGDVRVLMHGSGHRQMINTLRAAANG